MDVTFQGEVSAQESEGQTVTITITFPDNSTDQITTLTQSDKSYSTTMEFNVAGDYKAQASIPADSQYRAAISSEEPFTVTVLQDRTLTLTVTLGSPT